MEDYNLLFRFGVALIIGILVGLQREFSFEERDVEIFAGVRTFALMGLLGASSAYLSELFSSPWPLLVVLLVLGGLLAATHFVDAITGKVGLTTEMAAVLTVIAGALAYFEQLYLAVALGVAMAVLLSIKLEAQAFVRNLNREDIFAALKFAVVAAIVLPLLPNESYGPPPFDVFNPYSIWLLVVLISAISFIGYILNKVMGAQKGIGLTGLLGGLASSTAVTLNFSQRSKDTPNLSRPFAFAIIISWTVMFARVLVQAALVNPALTGSLWLPVTASVAVGLAYVVYLYFAQRGSQDHEHMEFANPFELGPAIKFGLLFAAILFISRAAQIYLSDTGIYLSSLVSGIADVNAITLSMAQLSRGGGLSLPLAARAIILATVANTVVKGAIVLATGSKELRIAIVPGYVLMTITGVVVAFLV